jgi:hypothetical protein
MPSPKKKHQRGSPSQQIEQQGNHALGKLHTQITQVQAPPIMNPVWHEAMMRVKARQDTMPPKSNPIEWMEANYFIPETKRPIKFEPYQKRALQEALSLDERGLFKYATIVWSDIKKSGKTSVAAAIIDWVLSEMPGATAKIIANDLDQADSRAAKMLRTNFKIHPVEGVTVIESRNLIKWANGSEAQSIAIDPSGEAGGNDNVISFDEIWGAHEKAKERMWTEMTISPLKFGKSFKLVTSYAGYLGESNLLWNLYLQGVDADAQFAGNGVKFDWCKEFNPPLECYHNDANKLFCLWNTVPRCSWQTPEYYASEAATITIQSEYNRIHRNQWATAVESFIPIEWWDACEVDELPPLEDEPVIVPLDGAISFDCFGKLTLSRHGDIIVVREIEMWQPTPGHKILFVNDEDVNDPRYPEGSIRQTARQYNVLEFPYDITHIDDMCSRLQREGIGFFRKFSQNNDRKIADKKLHDVIARRGIRWSKQTQGWEHLRAHLLNADAEKQGDKTMRIVKRAPNLHIDLAICLSMGVARCLHYRLG